MKRNNIYFQVFINQIMNQSICSLTANWIFALQVSAMRHSIQNCQLWYQHHKRALVQVLVAPFFVECPNGMGKTEEDDSSIGPLAPRGRAVQSSWLWPGLVLAMCNHPGKEPAGGKFSSLRLPLPAFFLHSFPSSFFPSVILTFKQILFLKKVYFA